MARRVDDRTDEINREMDAIQLGNITFNQISEIEDDELADVMDWLGGIYEEKADLYDDDTYNEAAKCLRRCAKQMDDLFGRRDLAEMREDLSEKPGWEHLK